MRKYCKTFRFILEEPRCKESNAPSLAANVLEKKKSRKINRVANESAEVTHGKKICIFYIMYIKRFPN